MGTIYEYYLKLFFGHLSLLITGNAFNVQRGNAWHDNSEIMRELFIFLIYSYVLLL